MGELDVMYAEQSESCRELREEKSDTYRAFWKENVSYNAYTQGKEGAMTSMTDVKTSGHYIPELDIVGGAAVTGNTTICGPV